MVMFTRFWHFRQNRVTCGVNDILNYFAGYSLYIVCKLCDFIQDSYFVISPHINPSTFEIAALDILHFPFPFLSHQSFFQMLRGQTGNKLGPSSSIHTFLCVFINRMIRMVQFSTKRTTDLKKQKWAAVLPINTCNRLHKFYCTQK